MSKTKRPWGYWEVLKEEPGRKIKLLNVRPEPVEAASL